MSWEITLLCFFSWNFIWFVQKEHIQVQNIRLLTARVKVPQICTLRDSFWWKYIQFQKSVEEKSIEDLCLMILKSDAKFEEKLIFCLKNNKNLVTQNFVWPKKVQRSYLSRLWRVIQNLKKNWPVVWKRTWRIFQISTTALEKSQNWDFDGNFSSKVENVWA